MTEAQRGVVTHFQMAQPGNGDMGLELRQSDFRDPVLNHYAGEQDLNLTPQLWNSGKTMTLARNTDFEFWLHLFALV